MRRYLLLCSTAMLCVAQAAFAQLQINKRVEHSALPMPFPDKLVKPASDYIITAHIPGIKKPFVVSQENNINRVRDFINTATAQCLSRKSPGPTIHLNAERINNFGVDLEWETKYAFKARGFYIERSLADTFHFERINFALVKPGTGIKKDYQLPDHNGYSGISFYRIKQTNYDVGDIYSNIVSLEGYDAAALRIYPNPASANISVEMPAKQTGNITITIYDASGKLMQQYTSNCTKGLVVSRSFDVSKFTPGLYQVKIVVPDKTFLAGKFIKQ